ncbi:hypothetical protein TRFO_27108 [Tritrichomonas foetus]|uniref:Uncharacterized protein n=1 Tax=Tritrichomonas foetus TaxID=1144522 RepID=A0A1J4K6A8_9EUKA|nr:hypothetical protein TRFO_27108 [Tritrichomonas foetus]|eukprot:OHT05236.1 hypothetical protein TRFO_27108 [Tritrichomonas foetus]
MTEDVSSLHKENKSLKKKIDQVKDEIPKIADMEIDVDSLNPSDYAIQESDTPDVKEIKVKIIKALKTRDALKTDLSSISQTSEKLKTSIDLEKYKNMDDINAELQKIKEENEKTENELFRKMAELQYQTSKTKKPKIKESLRENYDMRLTKIRAIEELRLKREQLSTIQSLPFDDEKSDKSEIEKDKSEVGKGEKNENEGEFDKSLKGITPKINMVVSSQQRLLDLRMDMARIDYISSLPKKETTDKNEDKKMKKLKEKLKKIETRSKDYEDAKTKGPEAFHPFLQFVKDGKKKLFEKKSKFYKEKINNYKLQIELFKLQYQTGERDKEETMKQIKTTLSHMKKFEEDLKTSQLQIKALNERLVEENSMLEQKVANNEPVESIYQEIASKNEQYRSDIQTLKMLKLAHMAEIAKVCAVLGIDPIEPGEPPRKVFRRIEHQIEKLKAEKLEKEKEKKGYDDDDDDGNDDEISPEELIAMMEKENLTLKKENKSIGNQIYVKKKIANQKK